MSEAIITSVITGLFSVIGIYLLNSKQLAVIVEKINQLEKRVEKHNNVVERVATCAAEIKNLKNK